MDHFEVEGDFTPEEAEQMDKACKALSAAVYAIASHFGVCPICLTYCMADDVSDAEDAGDIRHGIPVEGKKPGDTLQ